MRTEWTKEQMQEEFEVLGFMYGWCIVKRKADGVEGTLDFYTDDSQVPWTRYYHNFVEA